MGTMEEKPLLGLGKLVSSLGEVYKSGRTRDLSWRQSQLKGLIRLLTEKEEEILDVLHHDLGKHRTEAFRDEVRTFPCEFVEKRRKLMSVGLQYLPVLDFYSV